MTTACQNNTLKTMKVNGRMRYTFSFLNELIRKTIFFTTAMHLKMNIELLMLTFLCEIKDCFIYVM